MFRNERLIMIKILVISAAVLVSLLVYAQDQQPPQRPLGPPGGQRWARRGEPTWFMVPQRPLGPPGGQRGIGMFMMMDANKDGNISKNEMLAWFEKVDVNKDGVLTQEELQSARSAVGLPDGPRGPRGQGPRPVK
jgi:hypothetical protein